MCQEKANMMKFKTLRSTLCSSNLERCILVRSVQGVNGEKNLLGFYFLIGSSSMYRIPSIQNKILSNIRSTKHVLYGPPIFLNHNPLKLQYNFPKTNCVWEALFLCALFYSSGLCKQSLCQHHIVLITVALW